MDPQTTCNPTNEANETDSPAIDCDDTELPILNSDEYASDTLLSMLEPDKIVIVDSREVDAIAACIPGIPLLAFDVEKPTDPQLVYYYDQINKQFPVISTCKETKDALQAVWDGFYIRIMQSARTENEGWKFWFMNAVKTMNLLWDNYKGVHELPQTKKPALIVGNGPSLMRDIDVLASLKDQFYIISCLHATPKLLQYGIEPDLVVHIDKVSPEYEFVYPELPSKTKVVVAGNTDWRVTANYVGVNEIYGYLFDNSFVNQVLASEFESKVHHPCYGTVIYGQLIVAGYVGAKKMILLGVDLTCNNDVMQTQAMASYKSNLEVLSYYKGSTCQLFNASMGTKLEGYTDINLRDYKVNARK